ncbi:MAG: HAMP domain-containing protein, partial [Bacteroidales bacterium]|nr:HAMP domain-containing protein [Bacteroidales bacterium]
MKIKTKLNLGIGLLFSLIILLALFSINQINLLSSASENIIKDNKETIGYTTNMLRALSEIDKDNEALNTFETYLQKQQLNITELRENELTEKLADNFYLIKNNPDDEVTVINLKSILYEIMTINLKAIEFKNEFAKKTANKSIILISTMSFICFIIALILFIRLPGNISTPIKELMNSIKLIAANDYSQRVYFEGHTELGELAVSFNTMANKLEEYNNSSIAKLLTEKKITETIINKIHYPIIGFDRKMNVNLVNEEFLNVSGLTNFELIGANILELASGNDFVSQIIIEGLGNKSVPHESKADTRIHLEIHGKDIYFEKEIQEITLCENSKENEHVTGYVVILKNVTKYMELDLAKTNFIATVSHELKT